VARQSATYADNIVLLATLPEELQDLVSQVERGTKEYNMSIFKIDVSKTKVLTSSQMKYFRLLWRAEGWGKWIPSHIWSVIWSKMQTVQTK